MCTSNVTGNIGNRRVKSGWKRNISNVIDPGGGFTNTTATAEHMSKGSPRSYKSSILPRDKTLFPDKPKPKAPVEQTSVAEQQRRIKQDKRNRLRFGNSDSSVVNLLV